MAKSFSGSLGVGTAGALHATLGPVGPLARSGPGKRTPTAEAATAVSSSRNAKVERTLVLCTLYGGNDGLNTGIPYESSAYQALRREIAIPHDQALPLGKVGDVALGFHPALVGLKSLWDAGQVAVVLGVGYPNPSFSHFQSMEIMQSADPTGEKASGWLGRWLDASGSDPTRALSVGTNVPLVFSGTRQKASTLADSTTPGDQMPGGDPNFLRAYSELEHVYSHEPALAADIAQAGCNLLAVGAKAASALRSQKPSAPVSQNDPGDVGTQLDVVAELIKAGLPTKAYGVMSSSFDTHMDQLDTQANCSPSSTPPSRTSWATSPLVRAGSAPSS